MVFWGFILAVGGALAVLVTSLGSLSDIISGIAQYGFGAWIARFFAPQYVFATGEKIAFFIGVALVILGVILFFIGRAKAKKGGADAKADKGVKFFRDVKGEFKKITWPTFPAVVRNTGVTLALCILVGLIICLIDLVLGALIDLLLKLGQ